MQLGDNPEQMLRDGIAHYCDEHCNNPFLLNLRAAIHADPVLSELDLKDSRENAALLAEFLRQHFPQIDIAVIDTRSLLAMELIDSLARLVARVPLTEKNKLISEFVRRSKTNVIDPLGESLSINSRPYVRGLILVREVPLPVLLVLEISALALSNLY